MAKPTKHDRRPEDRTGVTNFVRRTGTIALGQAAVKSSQLILTVALVRLLAPAEWTKVAYLLSIYLAAVTIGTLNLQQGIVFFLPRLGPHHRRALLVQTAGLLGSSAVVIAFSLLLATPVLTGGRLDVGRAMPLLALALILELPAATAPAILIATEHFAMAAAWDLLVTSIQIGSVVVATIVGHSATAVMMGFLVGAAFRLLLFVGLVAFRFDGPLRGLPPGTLTGQLRYGLPLGLTLATGVLTRSADKWLVAIFDTGKIGVYAVAAQEIPLLAVLPYAGGSAIVVHIVEAFRRGDKSAALALWLRQTASMSLVVVPLSIMLMVLAPELITLIFTDSFASGVLPFQLFTLITVHRVAEYGLVLRAADRNRDLVVASVVLLASNAVCAGIGAAMYGATGASAGTLIANAIAWIFVLSRLSRVFGVPIAKSFAWSAWLGALLCAVAASFVAQLATVVTSTSLASVIVKSLAFAGTYLALVRCTGLHRSAGEPGSVVSPGPDAPLPRTGIAA